ncbi:MAG: threonine synthase, partial [Gammaproteobacteria bacterium]|nr:threonine synthase [Gammaproteobacteria bacterium]
MSFATHLECSLTGERYPVGEVHGLSAAGRPLLVRYDLDAVKGAVSKSELAARNGGFWKYREFLPTDASIDLGEVITPLVRLREKGRSVEVWVKDEGRLPTGSFKARGLGVAVA